MLLSLYPRNGSNNHQHSTNSRTSSSHSPSASHIHPKPEHTHVLITTTPALTTSTTTSWSQAQIVTGTAQYSCAHPKDCNDQFIISAGDPKLDIPNAWDCLGSGYQDPTCYYFYYDNVNLICYTYESGPECRSGSTGVRASLLEGTYEDAAWNP